MWQESLFHRFKSAFVSRGIWMKPLLGVLRSKARNLIVKILPSRTQEATHFNFPRRLSMSCLERLNFSNHLSTNSAISCNLNSSIDSEKSFVLRRMPQNNIFVQGGTLFSTASNKPACCKVSPKERKALDAWSNFSHPPKSSRKLTRSKPSSFCMCLIKLVTFWQQNAEDLKPMGRTKSKNMPPSQRYPNTCTSPMSTGSCWLTLFRSFLYRAQPRPFLTTSSTKASTEW